MAGQDEAKESWWRSSTSSTTPEVYGNRRQAAQGRAAGGPAGHRQALLAKAVAGEANVLLLDLGSDFVEMFVGMGAARVRDLFKEANKMAPCIVFIDEIDTIGKSATTAWAATTSGSRPSTSSWPRWTALTHQGRHPAGRHQPARGAGPGPVRPGRFDRRIIVDRPTWPAVWPPSRYTRNPSGRDVNLRKIAIATAGTVGADLANLVNEAALRAVRLGRKAVNQEDLLAAFELVIAGAEKKGSVLSEFEKKLVAYHEVGHAMVAYRQKHAEPVSKITIVPIPRALSAIRSICRGGQEDKHLHTRDELLAQITVSMGGRVAEELVLHTMTNGAAQISRTPPASPTMVAMFGMSEFGMMALASRRSQYLDGGYGIDCAQDTAAAMDRAVRDLIDACYKKAVEILSHSREDMDKVVEYCWRRRPSPARRWWLFWRAATPPWRTTSPTRTGKERPCPGRARPDPIP